MGYKVTQETDAKVAVKVLPVRSDVLHPCDIAEDIGIAYGYNNLKTETPKTLTSGKAQPICKFTDLLRAEMAQSGYIECLTMGLLSKKENFSNMRENINLDIAVQLSNPKTLEFEVVRTSLLPGLLKCVQSNKAQQLPLKLFEVSDVVHKA